MKSFVYDKDASEWQVYCKVNNKKIDTFRSR